jgi:hypothetical protein
MRDGGEERGRGGRGSEQRRGEQSKERKSRANEERAEQNRGRREFRRGQRRRGQKRRVEVMMWQRQKGLREIFVAKDPICKYSHEGEILGSRFDLDLKSGPRIWQNCNGANLEVYANHQFNHRLQIELTYHKGSHNLFRQS